MTEPAGLEVSAARGSALNDGAALDRFLAGAERRALRMAEFAVGRHDDALDIVQDAMITLVRTYRHHDPAQWAPLFHRIVQSRIYDSYRRRRVREALRVWLGSASSEPDAGEAAAEDPLARFADTAPGPEAQLAGSQTLEAIAAALAGLPIRQRQAFLLRAWEGLDVAATAAAMGCTEGSVKTHYSRAVHALRARLGSWMS